VSRRVALSSACHGPPKNIVTAQSRDRNFLVSLFSHA
jgi:hypothetical protein